MSAEKLATFVDSLEAVPEALRPHYEKVDADDDGSGYTLATDKGEFTSRLREFRANNVSLNKKLEAVEQRLGSVDSMEQRLEGLDRLLKQAQSKEDEEAITAGNIDQVVQRRVAAALEDGEGRLKALQGEYDAAIQQRDQYRTQVDRSRVQGEIAGAFEKAKVRVRPGAMVDIMARASSTWSVDHDNDGRLVARDQYGQVEYGEGGQPLGVAEYASRLARDAPHFFESGQGAGSPGQRVNSGVDARGKIAVDFTDPLAIGKNLEKLAAKKAVLMDGRS